MPDAYSRIAELPEDVVERLVHAAETRAVSQDAHDARRLAVLWDRSSPGWQVAEPAARERGWKLLSLELREEGDIERAFKAATAARAGAVLVSAPTLAARPRRVAELAARSRLPAMYVARPYVEAGGLIYYGADLFEIHRSR